MTKNLVVAIALAALLVLRAMAVGPFTVIAGGLVSPRGLTWGPGGKLLVAQAGNGGTSGKITEITRPDTATPTVRDIVTGFTSVGSPGQFVGVDGISALGNGTIYVIMASSNAADHLPQLGHLFKANVGGQIRDITDVGDFDYQWAADHVNLAPRDFPDANPYGVLALPSRVYVVDAGANTLNLVRPNGSDQILAFFPNNVLADSTPTCVAQGPDGALYIGTLALVDSIVFGRKAIVYRVDPNEVDPDDLTTVLTVATPWATGLWPINGCAFGPDGTFYASQLFTAPNFSRGDVVKIPFGNPASHTFLTGGALFAPAGVAVGPDGSIYVSNVGSFAPDGQVVRLTAH
jgi:hypothetical protein